MDDRIIQFRVGVLVVASCIITVILVVLFGEWPSFVRSQETINIKFTQAPGVTIDTPVRKSGILIGRVSEVELRDDGTVLVTAKIDAHRMPRQNEECRITAGNVLLGDAALEFVPGRRVGASTEYMVDGATIDGIVASSPLDTLEVITNVARMVENLEQDIRLALGSIRVAGEEVNGVASNLNAIVENNQGQFQRILRKSEQAIDRFDGSMATFNELVGPDGLGSQLRESLEAVPEIVQDARNTLNRIESMAQAAERNLENLEGFTQPLGQYGGDLVQNIDNSLGRLDELVAQFIQFGEALNNQEGSLGQFVHNPELYQRLNHAVQNFEELTFRLRPVVEDARIITDKIARDPARLGVKGLLDRRQSGIKW